MSLQKKIIATIGLIMAAITCLAITVASFYQNRKIEQEAELAARTLMEEVATVLQVTDSVMSERVRNSMNLLRERGSVLGPASLGEPVRVGERTAPNLLLGGQPQANRFELVDGVARIMDGTATIFSRQGNDFIRIATNVKQEDGKRAVGTLLDPNGAAIKNIREGKPYYGQVDILGNPFLTGYEPIFDAQRQLIGIWYVGYSADLGPLRQVIGGSRILNDGFVALLDARNQVRIHSSHVASEQVQAILDGKVGGWKVHQTEFTPWGYKIVGVYSTDEVSAQITNTMLYLAGGLILIAVLMSAILVGASRGITTRIALLHKAAEQIRHDKDFSRRTGVNGKDELGQLGAAFDELIESFQHALRDVSNTSAHLAAAANEMSAVSRETSDSVNRQRLETDQVATAMNEMAATVQEVARSTSSAADAASDADTEARAGSRVVHQTIDAIDTLANEVEKAASVIQKLETDSEEIGKVLEVIQGIAEQTNLLALNAAIEAARAGEQGRGFAVVADEVRTLASRTQQSTAEINDMIERIRHGTREAVRVMEESQASARRSVQQAAQAGASLDTITNAIRAISDLNAQIASAAEEQRAVAEEINRNIINISNAADQSAEQASKTSQESHELAQLADHLRSLVAQFKIS